MKKGKQTKPISNLRQLTLESFTSNKQKQKEQKHPRDHSERKKSAQEQRRLKNLQQFEQLSDISAKTEELPLYNVLFYSNKIQSSPKGDYIDEIHRYWWKNYALLENHHGFIQWLFPNEFKSRFNEKAFPLAAGQVQHFLHDPKIYTRYMKTYQMMLEFYGMVLKDKTTGQLKRSRNPPFEVRYRKTFLENYHNHMRITRILSSLCLLGFAAYAKQLSLFLKEEIYGQDGGLKQLAKLRIWEREWSQYLETDYSLQCRSDYFIKFK